MLVNKRRLLANVPKKNPPTFKNYNSGSLFNKILQQTNRSTSKQRPKGGTRSGWPQKAKISTDDKESNQKSVGPFPLASSKTRDV